MGRIRVIVAEGFEGSAEPSGLLRAVLEREGVEVAAEVVAMFDLIQLAADEQPDAVVFAAQVPQDDLDRLRVVAPDAKVVFVSPILTAAEAEMAEAVVERADVLASLGPVLVHLCTPGRINARRAITESFDRPDWIDRVRKDPVTLREILSETAQPDIADRPSISALQGEVRAAEPPPPNVEDVLRLPDLEAETRVEPRIELPRRRRTDVPVVIPPAAGPRRRSRRRLGLWSVALITLGVASVGLLPSTVPAALVTVPGRAAPLARDADAGHDRTRERDHVGVEHDADVTSADRRSTVTNGSGAHATPPTGSGGDGRHDAGGTPVTEAVDMPGSSAEHNPHGAPPGRTGVHPVPGVPGSLH